MHIDEAIAVVKAAGYRVTKPRVKTAPKLNAIGKPFSPQYDPNYRMKYRTPRITRKQNVGDGISPAKWAQMCKLAQADWDQRQKAYERSQAQVAA
jgi:hypothetical protein